MAKVVFLVLLFSLTLIDSVVSAPAGERPATQFVAQIMDPFKRGPDEFANIPGLKDKVTDLYNHWLLRLNAIAEGKTFSEVEKELLTNVFEFLKEFYVEFRKSLQENNMMTEQIENAFDELDKLLNKTQQQVTECFTKDKGERDDCIGEAFDDLARRSDLIKSALKRLAEKSKY